MSSLARAARTSALALLLVACTSLRGTAAADSPPALHLEHIGSDSTAFHVLATLVVGPTEVLLWDTQYHLPDALRVADRLAATGKRLTAIIISHPDHDHYMGAAAIVERFPGTPVYMTAAGLAEYERTSAEFFRREKERQPALFPDSLVRPRALPSLELAVDGQRVVVIPDLAGDVLTPTNSALWIPSLRTVLASDVAFDGVHPWLGASDSTSRAAWRRSLQRLAALEPKYVVAGHKRDLDAPDTPDVLRFMDGYLAAFDSLRQQTATAEALYDAMRQRYPDLAVQRLLRAGARLAFAPRP